MRQRPQDAMTNRPPSQSPDAHLRGIPELAGTPVAAGIIGQPRWVYACIYMYVYVYRHIYMYMHMYIYI